MPFDAMIDLALADDLRTSFMPPGAGDRPEDWQARGRVWRDDRTVIGASDAGAHLDMIDTFAVPTQVLGNGVRRHGVISLEEARAPAHRRAGAALRPARARPAGAGLARRRRRLRPADRSPAARPTRASTCRPARAASTPTRSGIDHVLVNGVEIVRGGRAHGRAARHRAALGPRHGDRRGSGRPRRVAFELLAPLARVRMLRAHFCAEEDRRGHAQGVQGLCDARQCRRHGRGRHHRRGVRQDHHVARERRADAADRRAPRRHRLLRSRVGDRARPQPTRPP